MYPTIYHAFLDLFGWDLPGLKFLNSFGFFVALAFVLASWTLGLDLRRRERAGLLQASTRKVTVGLPATPMELVWSGLIGFLLGWKGLYLVLNFSEATADPQGFLLSGKGVFIGGLVLGGLMAWLKWREKDKAKLKEPRTEEIKMLPSEHAGNITMTAALWGLIGAKIFHWLENPSEFVSFIQDPDGDGVFSGLTMYGGLIVAGAMVIRYFAKHNIPVWQGADSAAPGVMLAYGVGRIGCQVSGDGDWGIVNTTFMGPGPRWLWQYDYPNNVNGVGVPILDGRTCFEGYCTVLPETVFPTPLYETIVCVGFFFLLWSLRTRLRPAGSIFFLFLFLNGLERFFIEKIRVNVEVLPGITQAEIISSALMLAGVAGLIWLRRKKPASHGS
ncbi:MAG: prolipoprotein diacylglyceryl transferase [Flavobacteriales bacterium]|jgi:prolipoprotein diacylglyceryltransferase|nr:prolipoprotein diacylglyceryl transferase [Flavobacteriales bacterium]